MNAMPGMTETGFSGRPPVSSDTAERRASPFRSRGARSASTERVRSAEAEASLGYRKMCEEVISPLMAGLTKEMGILETRKKVEDSATSQRLDGLNKRMDILEKENSREEKFYKECLKRIESRCAQLQLISANIRILDSHKHNYVLHGTVRETSEATHSGPLPY